MTGIRQAAEGARNPRRQLLPQSDANPNVVLGVTLPKNISRLEKNWPLPTSEETFEHDAFDYNTEAGAWQGKIC